MDKVIYLETDEEITSVLDRMRKTEEKSVILVIPRGATLLQSLVNLKLLAKRAALDKKEIAFVTQDKIGRNLASIAGLSVYSDIKDKSKIKPQAPVLSQPSSVVVKSYTPTMDRIEEPIIAKQVPQDISKEIRGETKDESSPPKHHLPKPHLPWIFWGGLALGILIILGIVYLILPKARVNIQVKTEPYTQETEITVDQKATAVDSENRIIPGTAREQEEKETRKWQATGTKNVGTKAGGTITITNSLKNPDGSGIALSLPAGAEFKDKKTGKSFFSTAAASISKLTYDPNNGQPIPGTGNVKVAAAEGGASYNIGPSSFTIPSVGGAVSASSAENMSGGSDKTVTVVSDDDINKAKDQISKDLFTKAKDALSSNLEKGEKLLDGAIKEEVTKSSASKKAGDQVDSFEMTIEVKISTLTVFEKQYQDLINYYLTKSLPADKRLVQSASDTTDLTLISYDPAGTMRVKATLNTRVAPILNQDRLKEEIAKKDIQSAKAYLQSVNEIENASIQTWSLSKKLPAADRILIKISP